MKALVIVLPLTRASNAAHPEEPLDAAAIFSKVQEKYAQGETFSCAGTLTSTQNTVPALKDVRPFRVGFQRPDGIRLEWTDTQFLRGSQTSSIFTEAGKVLAHTPPDAGSRSSMHPSPKPPEPKQVSPVESPA
jgi:hypothetical protein